MGRTNAASQNTTKPARFGAWVTWAGMLGVAVVVALVFGLNVEPNYQPSEALLQPSPAWNGPLAVLVERLAGADTWQVAVGLHAASAALLYALTVALVRLALRGREEAGGTATSPDSAEGGRYGPEAHGPLIRPARRPAATEGRPARRPAATWLPQLAAVTTALLWGLHPLRVAAVFWSAWFGVVLGTLLAFTSLWVYLRAADSSRPITWVLLSFVAYAGSLLAGPVALFLPLVILLLNGWPLRRWGRSRAWVEMFVFALLAVVAAVGVGREVAVEQVVTPVAALTGIQRVMLGVFAAVMHVGRMLWPLGAVPVNELRLPVEATATRYLTALTLLVAACAAAAALVRRVPAIPVALAAYLLLLLSAVGIIPIGPVETAWAQSYLASSALFVLLGGLIAVGVKRAARRTRIGAAIVVVLVAECAVGLAIVTRVHEARWRSADDFWDAVIAQHPQSGLAYYAQARHQEALGSQPRAIALYRAAGQNSTWITAADLAEARLLVEDGEFAGAAEAYRRALRAGAKEPFIHRELAALLAVLGRSEEAESQFRAALEHAPGDLRARRGLANLLIGQQRCTEALDVLGDRPPVDDAAYWYAIGRAQRCAGDVAAARHAFEAALSVDPDFAAARRALDSLD